MLRIIAACLVGLLLGVNAGAEEFRSESGRFRVDVPPGWIRFAPFKLTMVKAQAEKGQKSIVHEGYELPNRFGADGFPFILIQEVREKHGPFTTFDQIEQSLNKDFRKGFEQGARGNATINGMSLNRVKNRFTAETEMRLPNGAKATGVIYGFLGKEGIVMVQCLGLEGDLAPRRPVFDAMADSFRYDEGFQFVPLDASKVLWVVSGIGAGLCCLVTMTIAVVATIIMMTKSAKPAKRRRSRD